jgi:ankyrin repeat protein
MRKTPLHLAVELGDVAMAKLLLSKGADSRLLDQDERSVLHYAAMSGDCVIVELILSEKYRHKIIDEKDKVHYLLSLYKLVRFQFIFAT